MGRAGGYALDTYHKAIATILKGVLVVEKVCCYSDSNGRKVLQEDTWIDV
jgi:hypothetical protein